MILDHIGINVSDFAASKAFFVRVFSLSDLAWWSKARAGR